MKGEGGRCTGAECLHTIKTKFELVKLGCCKFKMLIVALAGVAQWIECRPVN